MITTTFLAKAFGLYLTLTGLAMIFNRKYYLEAAAEMLEHKGLSLFTSIFTLILGIILVLFHNVWVWNWALVITILAWLTLLKGVARMFFPRQFEKAIRAYENCTFFYVLMVITVAIGVMLLCYGFCS